MFYSKQTDMLIRGLLLLSLAGCGAMKNAAEPKSASLPEPKIFNDKLVSTPSLNARATQLVFFGSGPSDIAPFTPIYKSRFDHAATTRVHPEIRLAYPAPGKKVYLAVTVHIRENGKTFRIVEYETRVDPDWTSSSHSVDVGVFGPGNWRIGTYETDIHINGEKVATGYFEVY
jgi:hypothetical protein